MNERWLRVTNMIAFLVMTLIAIDVQTVLWFHLVGDYTAPMLWLLTVTYFALRRPTGEALLGLYLISFLVASHSLAPWGLILLISLAVHFTLTAVRGRIYMESTLYFSGMGFLSVILFQAFHMLVSSFSDTNPIPSIIRWLAQALTTAGLAPLFFAIFEKVDEMTKRDAVTDSADVDSL